MEAFIVQNQDVEIKLKPFTSDGCLIDMNDGRPDIDVFTTFYEEGVMTLTPGFSPANDTQEATDFYHKVQMEYARKSLRLGIKPENVIELQLSFRKDWASMREYREAHNCSNDKVNVEDEQHCDALMAVKGAPLSGLSFLRDFNCKLNLNLEVFYVRRDWVKDLYGRPCQQKSEKRAGKIEVAGMELTFPANPKNPAICEEKKVKLPKGLCSQLRFDPCENFNEFSAKVTITLDVENYELLKSLTQITGDFDGPTDFILISADGSRFPCHKTLLEENSKVFKTIFSKNREESKANELVMRDMDSGVVDAFLKYLYVSAIDEPDKNPALALELFKAGHKYNISVLETHMSNILRSMLPLEFSREVVNEMISFCRNIGKSGQQVRDKAGYVLRALSKAKAKKR